MSGKFQSLGIRIASSLVMLAVFAAALFLGGIYITVLVVAVMLRGVYEVANVLRQTDLRPYYAPVMLCAAACAALAVFNRFEFITSTLALFSLMAFLVAFAKPVEQFKSLAGTLAIFIYPLLPFLYLTRITSAQFSVDNIVLILITIGLPALADLGAYFIGLLFGKHKLCPNLSPKKTVEGFIGGIILPLVLVPLINLVLVKFLKADIGMVNLFILAFAGSMIGQAGDLAASLVKRYAGVKDYAHFIPGIGGIMDRVDSYLLYSVFVYYYFSLVIG